MYLLSLCVIVSSLFAIYANPDNPDNPELTFYENENDGLGKSQFRYSLSDGTRNEQNINVLNTDNGLHFVEGSYSYQKNGIVTTVIYVADGNGYRPRTTIQNILLQQQHFPTGGIITLQGGGFG